MRKKFRLQLKFRNFKLLAIILVCAFWSLSVCWQAGELSALDADLWTLPQPPSSQVIWKNRPVEINGIFAQGTHIRCDLAAEEISSFYEQALLEDNWELKDNFKEQNITAFSKEEKFIYVAIRDNGKDFPCDIYLVYSPSDLALCKIISQYLNEEGIMQLDTKGRDIPDIPRYPGSRRMASIFAPEEGDILLYQTEGSPKEIAQFYTGLLKASGWGVVEVIDPSSVSLERLLPKDSDIDLDAFRAIIFSKNNDVLMININKMAKDKRAKHSLVTIIKNTIEELSSFSEEAK